MYKLFKFNDEIVSIIRVVDGTSFPLNPENSDYQAYLKWLAEGNEPLPADTQGAA